MKPCPSRETLQRLLASQLQAAEGHSVSAHLGQCAACRQIADDLTSDDPWEAFCHDDSVTIPMVPPHGARERLHALANEPTGASPAGDAVQHRTLGRYEIQECLGAGGFGIVYRAVDTQLHRAVALKLPRSSSLAEPQSRARFLHEARAVAGLRHPQIVALYDAGEVAGDFYLASAYAPGPTLARWIAEQDRPIAPQVAAQIAWALADATQHAHEHGVLHRDIKPHNVLLDPTIGFHDLPCSPKLTDFGVAKLLETEGSQTLTGELVGTPRYMAPELASGKRAAFDPALDIYSLGVVLYEMLTGQTPIEGASHADTLRRLVTEEPRAPRQLRSDVPRDLDAVCMRCLEKDPRRRYQSARQLSAELQRYLQGKPTLARPIGPLEKALRWTRHDPAQASLVIVACVAILLGITALAVHNRQLDVVNFDLQDANRRLASALAEAETAKGRAEASDERTRQLLYVTDMRLAGRAWWEGDWRSLSDLLLRHTPRTGREDLSGVEQRFLRNLSQVASHSIDQVGSDTYYVGVSSDRRKLATGGKDATVRIYDCTTWKLERSIVTGQVEVNSVAFSPDGRRLAAAGDDGSIRVWKLDDLSPSLNIPAYAMQAFHVAFSPGGNELITCGNDPVIHVWHSETGAALGEFDGQGRQEQLAVSPDGRLLAVAGDDGLVRVWNLTTRQPVHVLQSGELPPRILTVSFSRDNRLLFAAGEDQGIHVWSARTGQLLGQAKHLDPIHSLALSPSGQRLASSDRAGVVSVWALPEELSRSDQGTDTPLDLKCISQWQAHRGRVNAVAFADEERLITADQHGNLENWPIPRSPTVLSKFVGLMRDPVVTQGGRLLAIESSRGLVGWDLTSDPRLEQAQFQAGDFHTLTIDRQGKLLVSCASTGEVIVWDTTQTSVVAPLVGQQVRAWRMGPRLQIRAIRLTPDLKSAIVLVGESQKTFHRFDFETGERISSFTLAEGTCEQFDISPDGGLCASRLNDELLIWPVASMQSGEWTMAKLPGLLRIPTAHNRLSGMRFSADGKFVATFGSDRMIKFWDLREGVLLATLSGHRDSIGDVVFTSDGRSLITAGSDGCVKLWSVSAREELFDLARQDQLEPLQVRYSANGRWLACTSRTSGPLLVCDLGHPVVEVRSADTALGAR